MKRAQSLKEPVLTNGTSGVTLRPHDNASGIQRSVSSLSSRRASWLEGKTRDFTRQWHGCNVAFDMNGDVIFANKCVLSMCSPVFEAMFFGESRDRTSKEVNIAGDNLIGFIELMKVTHPPAEHLTDDNIVMLYPLFHKYKMEAFKDATIPVFMELLDNCSVAHTEKLFSVAALADQYPDHLAEVRSRCQEKLLDSLVRAPSGDEARTRTFVRRLGKDSVADLAIAALARLKQTVKYTTYPPPSPIDRQ